MDCGAAALAAVGVLAVPAGQAVAAPAAAPAPAFSVQKDAPASLLVGQPATFTLTGTNPGTVPEYNVSFRDVLPVGVGYVPGSTTPAGAGEPTVLADQPAAGQTTLIWPDVFDLQHGDANKISFTAAANTNYPVGAALSNSADGYANTDPRVTPAFNGNGGAVPGSYTASATSNTTSTQITAISIGKAEPSVEAKLLRGLHNHPTVYSMPVTNNGLHTTNGVVVTDYLPANLEFLGCGGVDNTTDAGTNPGSTREYPGAPPLTGTPVIAPPDPAGAAPSGCPVPTAVDTVQNPTGYPAGVYTKVSWNIGTLRSGEVYTINYAAGIPLRENTIFTGGPGAASGRQAANLDNNKGPSTRPVGPSAKAQNFVHAAGTYTGPVAPGTSTAVTADAQHTVTVNDLRIHKTVAPTGFVPGGDATYTLTIDAGEYVDNAGIAVTDTLPNGVCPLDAGKNYATGAPRECDPVAGDAPTTAFQSVTQNPDGTFTVTFSRIPSVAANGTTTISYHGRMRTTYTGGPLAGNATVAGDSFTNNATENGTSSPIPANTVDTGPKPVTDPTTATQTSGGPTLGKQVGERATPMACNSARYVGLASPIPPALTFAKGDRVCFLITATFAGSAPYRNPVLTDFLPPNVTYESGSYLPGAADTVPAGQVQFSQIGNVLTWTLGASAPDGKEIAAGAVFQAIVSGIVSGPAPGPHLAKLRTENSAGKAVSLRDQVDFAVAPAPIKIIKGVASVNGTANPGGGDHVAVKQGDSVVFHVDVSNTADPTIGPAPAVSNVNVWDLLPAGVPCAAVSGISDAGTCTNPGDPGQPTFIGNSTRSAVVWATGTITIAPGATHTYTYTVVVPADTSVAADLVNNAYVRSYTSGTDLGGNDTATHYPGSNVDTSVPVGQQDPTAATDPSDVYLNSVAVGKGVTSAIKEAGNNGLETAPGSSTQATIGEQVSYTVTAKVPARTTVYTGRLADPMPTGLALDTASATFAPDAARPGSTGSLPAGVTLDPATGTLSFGTRYDNASGTDQLFTVVITAHVTNTDATNKAGITRKNTATFSSNAGPGGGPKPPNRTAGANTVIVEPRPGLAKSNDNPAATNTVSAGQTVTFTLRASNATGASVLHDGWVVDCLPNGLTFTGYSLPSQGSTAAAQKPAPGPGGNDVSCAADTTQLGWNVGDIAPGASPTLSYTATVDPGATGSVTYTNNAALTGNSLAGARPAPTNPGNTAGRNYPARSASSVKITPATSQKSVTPDHATIGQSVTYTASAVLPANVTFYNTSLIDTLPPGIDPASVALVANSVTCTNADHTPCDLTGASQLTTAGSTIGWLLGNVAGSAQARTVSLQYTTRVADAAAATAGAGLTNSVHVAWDSTGKPAPTSANYAFDQTGSHAQATVTVLEPALTIAKSVSIAAPQPGQPFGYQLQVSNAAGPTVGAAYQITVTDAVPTGVVVDPATISDGGTIAGNDPATGGGTISWTITGPLAAGATKGLSYAATLAPSSTLTTAPLTNTATVTGYDSYSSQPRHYTGPQSTATVTPLFPRLTAAKSTPDGSIAQVGRPFPWQITVTDAANAGTAYTVGATDTLPANWTYDTGSARVSVDGAPATQVDPTVSTAGAVQTLTWTKLGTLPPGAAVVIDYTATPTAAVATDPGVGLSVDQTNTAAPTGTDNTGAAGNKTGPYTGPPATATAHIPAADLAISKTVGAAPIAGSNGSWTLTVTNNGPDLAGGPFTVTDATTPPAGVAITGAAGVGWSCSLGPVTCSRTDATDTLASGTSFTPITIDYSVAADVAEGTSYPNTASVSAGTFDPKPANNTATATATVTTTADLGIVKTLTSKAVTAGSDATYTVTVVNYGPSVSRGPITVTDPLPAGTSFVAAAGTDWKCDAAATGTLTCTYTGDLPLGAAPEIVVTVHVPSNQTADVVNTATVHPGSTSQGPNTHPDTDTVSTPTATEADLGIAKSLKGPLVAGDTAKYQIDVTNHGPSDAKKPVVTDTLPADLTYVSATGTNWTCAAADQTVTCTYNAATMPVTTSTILLTVKVAQNLKAPVSNTASVKSDTRDHGPSPNTDTTPPSNVTAIADLSIGKTHAGDAVAGKSLDYTLAVHNYGPSNEAGDITIKDLLPAGFTYQSATGTGWNCNYDDPSRTVTCTGATGLAAGADAAPVTLTVMVDPDAGPATLTNTAAVIGNPDSPDPVPDTEHPNTVDDPTTVDVLTAVSLTKTLITTTPVVAGTDATFTLQASNAGPSDATVVAVTDTLPAHLSFKSAVGNGWDCSAAGQVITCTRDTLPAQPPAVDVAPITVVAHVDPATPIDPADGTTHLTNTAAISTGSPGTVHQPDPVDVPVVAKADLSLVKTGSTRTATAGTLFSWTIAVANNGPSDAARPITVTDTLPGYQTFQSGSGTGWTCTAGPAPAPPADTHQIVTCALDAPLAAGTAAPNLALTVAIDPRAPVADQTNTAKVDSPTPDPDPSNNTGTATVGIARAAALTITKTHTGTGQVGKQLSFDLTVHNAGPSVADRVVVTDQLPAGLAYVSATGTDWTCTARASAVSCALAGELARNTDAPPLTVVTTVGVAAYPTVSNTATVTSPDLPGSSQATDKVTVQPDAVLQIVKKHVGVLTVGKPGSYTISVRNAGPTATPGPVTVTDNLPAGLRYTSATGGGWTCDVAGQHVSCSRPGTLAVNTASTITLLVDVLPAAYPQIVNAATASALGAPAVSSTDTAAVTGKSVLGIVKSLAAYTDGTASYTVAVSNAGPNPTSKPVTISDTLPAGLRYRSATGPGWICTVDRSTVNCVQPAPITAASSAEVIITADVTARPGDTVTNIATLIPPGGGTPIQSNPVPLTVPPSPTTTPPPGSTTPPTTTPPTTTRPPGSTTPPITTSPPSSTTPPTTTPPPGSTTPPPGTQTPGTPATPPGTGGNLSYTGVAVGPPLQLALLLILAGGLLLTVRRKGRRKH